MVLQYIIGATVLVSLVSLVGVLTLGLSERTQKKILMLMVAFASGTMLATAFFDLLPESIGEIGVQTALSFALAGIIFFFVVEKIVLWHHHHAPHKKGLKIEGETEKPLGYLNLVGDGMHNFFDGIAIAAAFLAGFPVGVSVTFAVMLHEIPQEIGDFGLLLYSGFSRRKAIAFNLLSALTAVAGGVLFYFASPYISNLEGLGLAFTAGGFVYMSTGDLFPEFHRETDTKNSLLQLALILAGILFIWLFTKTIGR